MDYVEVPLFGKYSHLKCKLDKDWYQMICVDGGCSLMHRNGYASIFTGNVDKYDAEFVHQLIMDEKTNGRNRNIDHINEDRLDNRESNLRIVNKSENALNVSRLKSHNKSGTCGLHFSRQKQKWRVFLAIDSKRVYDKYMKNEQDARSIADFHNLIKNL